MNIHKIKDVKVLKYMIIEVTFYNEIIKEYDIKPLLKRFEAFKKLTDPETFNKVKVDVGGYGIVWNKNIDLSSEEIWKNGIDK
ncbi:MAG: DUF2442 domain-containing protein [Clostridia bacterium]|nr:DUF2442 domain-containing protein [Clostridia bacterium]